MTHLLALVSNKKVKISKTYVNKLDQGDHSFPKSIFHDFFQDKKMKIHDLSAQHIFSK